MFNRLNRARNDLKIFLRTQYYRYMIPPNLSKKSNTANNKGSEKIIVSLTSYGSRLSIVDICIKSIMNQTLKPDEIRLYLGTDVTDEMIPERLTRLRKYGLTIIKECEDIKPHKKYYYAMKSNPDDIIITVDDDVIYERSLIKRLYKGHLDHPDCVICTRAVKITRNKDGSLEQYVKWPVLKEYNTPTFRALPTGLGGVLYPPHSLDQQVFNMELIKTLCLDTDDIWLRMMGVLHHTPVVLIKYIWFNPDLIKAAQSVALSAHNKYRGKNDMCLRQIEQYFKQRIDQNPEAAPDHPVSISTDT